MKDTAKMKSIDNTDINKNIKRKRKNKSGLGVLINVFGIILLVIMMTIVGVNFARDARVFEKPILSSDANGSKSNTDSNTGTEAVSGTIKYKKPDTGSSGSSGMGKPSVSKKSAGSSKGQKPATPTPTQDP